MRRFCLAIVVVFLASGCATWAPVGGNYQNTKQGFQADLRQRSADTPVLVQQFCGPRKVGRGELTACSHNEQVIIVCHKNTHAGKFLLNRIQDRA